MTLVDWSYAIMESGIQFGRGLTTLGQLLPADSLALLNILVSDINMRIGANHVQCVYHVRQ